MAGSLFHNIPIELRFQIYGLLLLLPDNLVKFSAGTYKDPDTTHKKRLDNERLRREELQCFKLLKWLDGLCQVGEPYELEVARELEDFAETTVLPKLFFNSQKSRKKKYSPPGGPKSRPNLSILHLSRDISNEALNFLYGSHIFWVDPDYSIPECSIMARFSHENCLRIRHLVLYHEFEFDGEAFGSIDIVHPDHRALWQQISSGLSTLYVILEPRRHPSPYWGVLPADRAPGSEWYDFMYERLHWTLDFYSKYVPKNMIKLEFGFDGLHAVDGARRVYKSDLTRRAGWLGLGERVEKHGRVWQRNKASITFTVLDRLEKQPEEQD
ncbi:hypothetical protein B0H63DRAFT_518138 [Podospora didyma]|uniref:Uncharacterized protein n=1 Tax=Podospora didyma TaxID=330526 RepID=A0AAE0P850_9PEZI|nr:hypothetical protein B0H63DRAFT_518138 [Podospora didyma]